MTLLIDAFNLIHAVDPLLGILSERGPHAASLALTEAVTRWLELHPNPPSVILVFDGARPHDAPVSPPVPSLQLRWMLDGADADLKVLLERKGQHVLVSSDAELVAHARREAQDVRKPRGFFNQVLDDMESFEEHDERSRPLSRAEVDDWLEHFGEPRGKTKRPPPAPPGGLAPDEVAYWLAWFRPEGG